MYVDTYRLQWVPHNCGIGRWHCVTFLICFSLYQNENVQKCLTLEVFIVQILNQDPCKQYNVLRYKSNSVTSSLTITLSWSKTIAVFKCSWENIQNKKVVFLFHSFMGLNVYQVNTRFFFVQKIGFGLWSFCTPSEIKQHF